MDKIKSRIERPLTNHDIYRILPQARGKLIEYSQLNDVVDLSDILLPHENSFVIILIEYQQDSGHWICVLRRRGLIELYNPFGVDHSRNDFEQGKALNESLGQASMSLRRLLDNEAKQGDFEVWFNPVQHQSKSLDVQTCGRHCLLRLICLLTMDMSGVEYNRMLRRLRTALNADNYDQVVATLIK